MQLDLRTIMVLFTTSQMVFALVFALVAHRHPHLSAPKWWFASCLSCTVGFLAIALRGKIPDSLSIIAAAGLLYISITFLWLGLRAFFNLRIYWGGATVFVLSGIVVQSLFVYVWPSVAARQILFSAIEIVVFLLALRELGKHRRPAITAECYTLAAFLLAGVLLNLVRITAIGKLPDPADYMSAGRNESLFLFVSFILESGLLLTLLTLINSHLDEKQKQSEEALTVREAHFRTLTEDVSDVIWKQDCDHRFTYISPADERLRGYRADEVIGHLIFEWLTEEGVATATEAMRQRPALKKDGAQTYSETFEVQQRCKDGNWIWAEVVSTPEFDERGAISGYYGVSRDITERRRVVEALIESETKFRAIAEWKEKQLELQSRFIDMLTHELRASLTVVRLATSSLSKQLSERAPEIVPRLVNIGLAVDGMNSLVDRCIKAERIEQGELAVYITSCSLQHELAGVITDEECASTTSGRIRVQLNGIDTIKADPQLLRVMLSNLINNAVKYSPFDSPIEVEAAACEHDSRAGLEIVVRNQVVADGLPDAAQMFTRFYRSSHKSNTRTGIGLGLYLVNALSRMHDGHARFEASADNQSLSISVWLPDALTGNTLSSTS